MGVDRLPSRRWEVDWKVDVFSPCPAEGSQRARWRGTPPPAVNSPLTTDPKLSIPGTRGELYCKKKESNFWEYFAPTISLFCYVYFSDFIFLNNENILI